MYKQYYLMAVRHRTEARWQQYRRELAAELRRRRALTRRIKRELQQARIDNMASKDEMKRAAQDAMLDLQRLNAIAARDGRMSADAFRLATVLVLGIVYLSSLAHDGADWVDMTAEHVRSQLAAGLDYVLSPGHDNIAIHIGEGARSALRCYLALPAPAEGDDCLLFRDRSLDVTVALQRFGARYLPGKQPPTWRLLRRLQISEVIASCPAVSYSERVAKVRYPVTLQEQSNADAGLYHKLMGAPPAWPVGVELGDEAPEGLADGAPSAKERGEEDEYEFSDDDSDEEDESEDDQLSSEAEEPPQTIPWDCVEESEGRSTPWDCVEESEDRSTDTGAEAAENDSDQVASDNEGTPQTTPVAKEGMEDECAPGALAPQQRPEKRPRTDECAPGSPARSQLRAKTPRTERPIAADDADQHEGGVDENVLTEATPVEAVEVVRRSEP